MMFHKNLVACFGSAFLIASLLIQTGCQSSHPNATIGGLLGATTGGMVGAAIGSHEGKSSEGALIGALAGGVTGAAIGNQTDEANIRYQQSVNENASSAQQAAVTFDQVIQMSQSGLSDELIQNQIKANGVAQRVGTNDIIQLKSQGVSDLVIGQLQTTGSQPPPIQRTPSFYAPRPVIHVDPYCPPIYRSSPIFRPPPVVIGRPVHAHRRARGGFRP